MKCIQASESQLQSLQGETEAVVTAVKYVQDEQQQTTSVQKFFHSTPLISRRGNQPNSQGMNSPPLFNSTPVTIRMEPQITGSRQNIPQSVKSTVWKNGGTYAIGENGATYAVGESGAMYAEPHVNMNVGNTETMIDRRGSFQPCLSTEAEAVLNIRFLL